MQYRVPQTSSSLEALKPYVMNENSTSNLSELGPSASGRKILDGGYSSVNILPVIGSEMSTITHETSNPKFSKVNSKIELTRKDIQNFLVNGSISN